MAASAGGKHCDEVPSPRSTSDTAAGRGDNIGKPLSRGDTHDIGKTLSAKRRSVVKRQQQLTLEAATRFDDPTLMRALPSYRIMQNAGELINGNRGSMETYNMSTVVTDIEIFVSHNWTTPRLQKLLVLILTFNAIPGVIAALLVAVATFCMARASYSVGMVMPATDEMDAYQEIVARCDRAVPMSPYAFVCGEVAFFYNHLSVA